VEDRKLYWSQWERGRDFRNTRKVNSVGLGDLFYLRVVEEDDRDDSQVSGLGDWVGGSTTHQDWKDWRMGLGRKLEGH
jgi:hypothetical protein